MGYEAEFAAVARRAATVAASAGRLLALSRREGPLVPVGAADTAPASQGASRRRHGGLTEHTRIGVGDAAKCASKLGHMQRCASKCPANAGRWRRPAAAVVGAEAASAALAPPAFAASGRWRWTSQWTRCSHASLSRRLERLKKALHDLPREHRAQMIRSLGADVRAALLRHMEAGEALATPMRRRRPSALTSMKVTRLHARQGSASPKARREQRGRAVGVQGNKQGLFRAKICVGSLCLYSAYSPRKIAHQHRAVLQQLRTSAKEVSEAMARSETPMTLAADERGGAATSGFPMLEVAGGCVSGSACDAPIGKQVGGCVRQPAAGASGGTPSDGVADLASESSAGGLIGLGLSRAYVNVHAARWLGSRHVTSPMLPVAEAVQLRDEVMVAREKGWEAFREACIGLLQHPGFPPARRRSRSQAEALIDEARRRVLEKPAKAAAGGAPAPPQPGRRTPSLAKAPGDSARRASADRSARSAGVSAPLRR